MSPNHKKLVWLSSLLATPPLSQEARVEAGYLLRRIQSGENIGMPHSRPMPTIGKGCHELRINDKNTIWRIFYRIDSDFIVIPHWTTKKTQKTSQSDINLCQSRLTQYDSITGGN
jgi:phage-related protein